jgi:periplasmic divalent cation tolerance protein
VTTVAVTVTTTVDDRQKATELAHGAVSARLAACGQVGGPIASVYWWQGEVEEAQEWTVVFKTTAERASDLIDHVKAAHPYAVPEVLVTPVTGGDESYLAWMHEETRPR